MLSDILKLIRCHSYRNNDGDVLVEPQLVKGLFDGLFRVLRVVFLPVIHRDHAYRDAAIGEDEPAAKNTLFSKAIIQNRRIDNGCPKENLKKYMNIKPALKEIFKVRGIGKESP